MTSAGAGHRLRVVGLGLVMADIRVVCPGRVRDESDPSVEAMDLRLGGATANVLIALRRLGAGTALASVVGDDWLGRFLRDRLDAQGVDHDTVLETAGPSASCLVLETPPTRTLLWHVPEPLERAALTLRPHLPRLVAGADAVHVNGRFPEAARELCALALDRGATVSLNAGRGEVGAGVAELLPYADVLVAADSWACEHTGAATAREACARLTEGSRAPRLVSVTCGEHGSWTAGPGLDRPVHTPAPVVADSLPTAGAGDAFHAGLLAAALTGAGPEECARAGAEAAGRHLTEAAVPPPELAGRHLPAASEEDGGG